MIHLFLQDVSHQLRDGIQLAKSAINLAIEEIRRWEKLNDSERKEELVRCLQRYIHVDIFYVCSITCQLWTTFVPWTVTRLSSVAEA